MTFNNLVVHPPWSELLGQALVLVSLVDNSLQREVFGLFEEEIRQDGDHEIEYSPEQKRSPAHSLHHVGRRQREEKVEEPL